MMVGTCDSGSAAKSFRLRDASFRVAGKTGTLTRTEPFYMEHSWFVGFAPADNPEIIVSVLFGNPESWHLRGHEAARKLFDKALKLAKARNKDRTASVEPSTGRSGAGAW
jgi:cell division protein FtsI/penicillin-binding protein 2